MATAFAMIAIQEVASHIGLLVTCTGDLNAKDLSLEMSSLRDRFPNLSSWYFAVADLADIGQLNVSATEFDLLVEQHLKLSQFTRPQLLVAVIARSEIAFGISRMWQVSSEATGWESQVFRERGPAEAWLRARALAQFQLELPELRPQEQGGSSSRASA